MKHRMLWLFGGLLAVAFLVHGASGDEKTGTKEGTKEGTKSKPLTKEQMEARTQVDRFKAAVMLAEYGQKNKSVVALLAAAEQLWEAQPRKMTEKDKELAKKLKEGGLQEAAFTPESLLAEARNLASDDASKGLVSAMQKKIEEAPRGRMPGPFVGIFNMAPKGSFGMQVLFKGGEEGVIGSTVQGGGQVRLVVSDPKAGWSQSQQGQRVEVRWLQPETGNVTFIRDNLEDFPIRVYVWTN